MRRGLGSWAALGVAVILLAGCRPSANTPANVASPGQPTGTLTGTLAIYGGKETARPCGCTMQEGTVKLSRSHGTSLVVNVDRSGKFAVQVPAGRYTVEAGTQGWPMGSCGLLRIAGQPEARPQPEYLIIRQSRTTHVSVGCLAL
jgi:hypothetical protein